MKENTTEQSHLKQGFYFQTFETEANITCLLTNFWSNWACLFVLCIDKTLNFPLIITFQNMRTGSFRMASTLRERTEMTPGSLPASLSTDREVSAVYATDMCLTDTTWQPAHFPLLSILNKKVLIKICFCRLFLLHNFHCSNKMKPLQWLVFWFK